MISFSRCNLIWYYKGGDVDIEEMDFQMFCMLASEMITVEVEVRDEWYLVTGDTVGEILCVREM